MNPSTSPTNLTLYANKSNKYSSRQTSKSNTFQTRLSNETMAMITLQQIVKTNKKGLEFTKKKLRKSFKLRSSTSSISTPKGNESKESSSSDAVYDGSKSTLRNVLDGSAARETLMGSMRKLSSKCMKISPFAQFIFDGDDEDTEEDEQESMHWEGCQNI